MRMLVLMLLTFKKVKLIFGHPVASLLCGYIGPQYSYMLGRVLGTKVLNPPLPVQVGGSCRKLERLIQQELRYLAWTWYGYNIKHLSSVHTLKKRRL